MASVELRGLVKRFGSFVAVDDVSLTIDHGQLVCLLGPSGCGKTTTLRLIAGFLEPSDGEIRVGDRVVSSRARTLPPEQRNMSMIFQSYALWPHMTVAENIVYGLRLRKMDRDTIAKKLAAILKYHVVPGNVKAADVAGKKLQVKTVQGQTVSVDGTLGVTVNDARVIQPDIVASNGVIHVIDTVLLPPAAPAKKMHH